MAEKVEFVTVDGSTRWVPASEFVGMLREMVTTRLDGAIKFDKENPDSDPVVIEARKAYQRAYQEMWDALHGRRMNG